MPKAHNNIRHVAPHGRIVFNDGLTTVSCSVHQLSGNGATLQVHSVFGIPNAFLLALNDSTRHPCWVVRKAAKEIKVVFTDWQSASAAIGT